MASLEIRLLGSFEARLGGKPLTGFESNKVRALLARLATEASRPQTRESLAELLWPGWPQQSAMSNLRYVLSDLRKNIGDREAQPHYLCISRERLQLNLVGDVWVDAYAFGQAIRQAETGDKDAWQRSADLYCGSFLEGFILADNSDFMDWVASKRAYYQDQAIKALRQVAVQCEENGNYEQGLRYAQRQVEIKPWLEEGHRQVMRLLALTGQRSAAMTQYGECKRILEKELGAAPSVETCQLYKRIRDEKMYAKAALEVRQAEGGRHLNNLPNELTSFIGRGNDIAEIGQLLSTSRLVTLSGAGGVGKTRLALRVGMNLMGTFTDGVWLVELAALADSRLVSQAVIQVFGLRETPGCSAMQFLREFFSDKQLLIILDNCEHRVTECAELASELLHACSSLRILVTSRELLGVMGEIAFRVPSLTAPAVEEQPRMDQMASYESVRLFVERAQTAAPGFALAEANAAAVGEICRRLDGIPLAIELAAARVRLLSVQQIAERLGDVFYLLMGGTRTAPPRQQTLRATIDWSYNLLPKEEQALLRYLSVFSEGWNIEAAEGVCSSKDGESQVDVLGGLGRLVDKSLIQASDGEIYRYHMLETIRKYALEKLISCGEMGVARRAHLQYFMTLAKRIEPEFRGRTQIARFAQMEQDLGNLRGALGWGLQHDLVSALRLASALNWFWKNHSHTVEGADWLDRGLNCLEAETLPPDVIAKALAVSGVQHRQMGYQSAEDMRLGEVRLKESLQIYLTLGEDGEAGAAFARTQLAFCELFGNQRDGEEHARKALAFYEVNPDHGNKSDCISVLGEILGNLVNDSRLSIQWMEESLKINIEMGDVHGMASEYTALGWWAFNDYDLPRASSLIEKSIECYQQVGDQHAIASMLVTLGRIHYTEGNYPAAIEYYQKAEKVLSETGIRGELLELLGHECFAFLNLGQIEQARLCLKKLEEVSQEKDNHFGEINIQLFWGVLAYVKGDFQKGDLEFTKAIDWELERHNSPAYAQEYWGRMLCTEGRDEEGKPLLVGAIEYFAPLGIWGDLGASLDGLARVAAGSDPERSVRLFGAAEKIRPYLIYKLFPVERSAREVVLARVRSALGEERLAALWAEGRAMSLKEAVEYALGR